MEVNFVGAAVVVQCPVNQQLETDDDDKEVGSDLKAGEAFEQFDEHGCGDAHEHQADDAAGDYDPQFGVRGIGWVVSGCGTNKSDRGEDGVNSEGDIGEFNNEDGGPEVGGRRGLAAFPGR